MATPTFSTAAFTSLSALVNFVCVREVISMTRYELPSTMGLDTVLSGSVSNPLPVGSVVAMPYRMSQPCGPPPATSPATVENGVPAFTLAMAACASARLE